jgi:DNA-binding MarR family transcriptional regulator
MREAIRPRDGSGIEEASVQDALEAQATAEASIHETAQRYKQELQWADPDTIEVDLAFIRASRMHRLATGRMMDQLDLDVGMTGARYTLLLTLFFARDNLLAQNEISRELSVSRTNITNLIDGLERDGLVARVPNPADRRVSYAQLTKSGEAMCMDVLPYLTRTMMDELSGFSEEEKMLFKEFLYRMQRNIVSSHPAKYGRGIGTDGE